MDLTGKPMMWGYWKILTPMMSHIEIDIQGQRLAHSMICFTPMATFGFCENQQIRRI